MLNVQLLNLSNEVHKLDLVEIYDDFLRKIGSRAIHIDFKDNLSFHFGIESMEFSRNICSLTILYKNTFFTIRFSHEIRKTSV